MANFQHSRSLQAEVGWSDEVHSDRQDNKNTVKDLIHLYDKKEKKGPPTQDQESSPEGQSSTQNRHENYYSEEPRQRHKPSLRRQHSQPRDVKHHSYSRPPRESQLDRPSRNSGEPQGLERQSDKRQKRNSLASKSWATPDDVSNTQIVSNNPITHEQRGTTPSGRRATEFTKRHRNDPRTAANQPTLENRIPPDGNQIKQFNNREQQIVIDPTDKGYRERSRLQQSKQSKHNRDSQYNLQQESGGSQGSRSSGPSIKVSRDYPQSQRPSPVHLFEGTHSRTRSQSPRTHLSDKTGRSTRSQSPSVQVIGQARTLRSSSTPRPESQHHRDSPSEQVSRVQKHSTTTPPPVQYNKPHSFRSRSQSPHVNRTNRERLASQSHHTLQTGSQSNSVQRPNTEHSLKQEHSRSDKIKQPSRQYDQYTGRLVSNSPHTSSRHSKQGSNISSSSSTGQRAGSRDGDTKVRSPEGYSSHNQQRTHAEQRSTGHSASREKEMKVDSQRLTTRDSPSWAGNNIHANQEMVSQDRQMMVQSKPPLNTKKEQHLQQHYSNLDSRNTSRHSREKQDNFKRTASAGLIRGNSAHDIHSQSDARHSKSHQFNTSTDSNSSHGNVHDTGVDKQRQRLRDSPQSYTSAADTGTMRSTDRRSPHGHQSYVQIGRESPHIEAVSVYRGSPQSRASTPGSDSFQTRGSYTPSPTHTHSPVASTQQRTKPTQNTQNTPSPTSNFSTNNHQQRAKHQHTTTSAGIVNVSSQGHPNQHQRGIPQSNASLLGDEYFSYAQNVNVASQNVGSESQQSQQMASPLAYGGDVDSGSDLSEGGFIQTYSLTKPYPNNERHDESSDAAGSFIQTYSLSKPPATEEKSDFSKNYVQTYSMAKQTAKDNHPQESDMFRNFIKPYLSSNPHTKDRESADSETSGNFIQTYSVSKPAQVQPSNQDSHIEAYTLTGDNQKKNHNEKNEKGKKKEGNKMSHISKALLGWSGDAQNLRRLHRSRSADIEKMLSGPREKWNIDPPRPCGTVPIRHIRQRSDEPLGDPTYSYVRTGQRVGGKAYPGEGEYSELQGLQPVPQHTRHASYDGSMGTVRASTTSISTPHTLHYMPSPLYYPNYEEIVDNDVNSYEKPVSISDRKILQDTNQEGEIVMDDQDNVSYLEPVATKFSQSNASDIQIGYHRKESREQVPQDKIFVKTFSPESGQSVRPVSEGKSTTKSNRHSHPNTASLTRYNLQHFPGPSSDATGSSSPSAGSKSSPDSIKRSYTATMIGGKQTIRQVTLLESNPSGTMNYVGVISEDDTSVFNKTESVESGHPNSFDQSGLGSEENGPVQPMPLFEPRYRRRSSDRPMSLHSASSLPDLGQVTDELKKGNETLHMLTKNHDTLKTEMSKSFELLFRYNSSHKDRITSHGRSKKHYQDITIHRVFKHVANSVAAFRMSWHKLLSELFHSYPSWFVQWVENQITKETRIEKECIHECLVQWQEFQETMSDVELMVELKRVLEVVQLGSIAVGMDKILAKDNHNREQCIEHLDDKFLTSLAQQIGKEWKNLGVYLGFTLQELQQLESDHHKNMGAAIQEMLVSWRNKHGPSMNMLVKGFIEVKRMDLVDRLRPILILYDTVKPES